MMYKTIILTLVIIFSEYKTGNEKQFEMVNINYYPMFIESYKHVRKWEGNYSYLQDDRGGETYAGITRTFNGDWEGWEVVDEYKGDSSVKWNQKIDNVEIHVMQYYYSVWLKDGYHKINDPIVRDYLFDYRNTGLVAYKHVKEILIDMGFTNLNSRPVMDESTINAINKSNPMIFILRLQEIRRDYYERVADTKPELRKYLKGWLNRANDIIV